MKVSLVVLFLLFSMNVKASDADSITVNTFNLDAIDAYSENAYGITAMSLNGTAGWFGSAATQTTEPIMVLQTADLANGSANFLEVQDENGTAVLKVDSKGLLMLSGPSESCSASTRGAIKVVKGGTGVADTLQVCLKSSGGTYSFVTK